MRSLSDLPATMRRDARLHEGPPHRYSRKSRSGRSTTDTADRQARDAEKGCRQRCRAGSASPAPFPRVPPAERSGRVSPVPRPGVKVGCRKATLEEGDVRSPEAVLRKGAHRGTSECTGRPATGALPVWRSVVPRDPTRACECWEGTYALSDVEGPAPAPKHGHPEGADSGPK